MDLVCVPRMLLSLRGDRFAGNGVTRVLNDLLMIPKVDVRDAAFHLRPPFKDVLSISCLTPFATTFIHFQWQA